MKTSTLLTLSAGQNPVNLVILGNPVLPKLVLIGGVHGDEPEGVEFLEDFIKCAEGIAETFKATVLAIPCLNPDGFKKNERVNAHGVDLNRNFPSEDWTPHISAPRYHPGPRPKSEPETAALVKLLLMEKPFLVVHVHSYIPQMNYTGEISKKWAQAMARDFGYPITDNIGYPTPGSLGQYCFYNLKTPCVCVELPEKVERTQAWKMTGPALLEIAQRGP